MIKLKTFLRAFLIVPLLALLLTPGTLLAADSAGQITMLTGRATAATMSGDIRNLVKNGSVYSGEVINTGPNTYVNIKFTDGGRILLRPNTRFQIEQYSHKPEPAVAERDSRQQADSRSGSGRAVEDEEEDNAVFRLLKGGFRAITGLIGRDDKEDYKVRTPVATIGIRGTDFEVRLCDGDCYDITPIPQDGLYTGVFEGGIVTQNGGGSLTIGAGQYGYVPSAGTQGRTLRRRPKALSQDPMPDPENCE